MVRVFQHLRQALRRKDLGRQSQGLPPRYWVLEDIDEFVHEFRPRASELAKVPWATYDYMTPMTTLYGGLPMMPW